MTKIFSLMENKEFKDDIGGDLTPDDMPNEDMTIVALEMGVDVAIKMCQSLGGLSIYIPGNGWREIRKRYIEKHRDDMNTKRMAITLGTTERWIRKVLNDINANQL